MKHLFYLFVGLLGVHSTLLASGNSITVGDKSFTIQSTFVRPYEVFGKQHIDIFLFPSKLNKKDQVYLTNGGSPNYFSTKAPKGWEKYPAVCLTLRGGSLEAGKYFPADKPGANAFTFTIYNFFEDEEMWGDTTIPLSAFFSNVEISKKGSRKLLHFQSNYSATGESPHENKKANLDFTLKIPKK